MIILGVNLGESTSAAILCEGNIVAASQEERFVRKKNISGFPYYSILFCLKEAGVSIDKIDHVAIADLTDSGLTYSIVQRRSSFSVLDYWKEAREFWYPILYKNENPNYLELFRDKIDEEVFPKSFLDTWLNRKSISFSESQWLTIKRELFCSYFPGFPEERIELYEHHQCHAFHSFFSSPFCESGEKAIVCTADSFGDYCNAAVTIFGDGFPCRVATTNRQNLGRIYRNMTLLLGMKPYRDEYKVMGLAPYASLPSAQESQKIFEETLQNEGTDFSYKIKPKDHFFYFKEKLEGHRFDAIAGGLQFFFENRIVQWIENCAVHYKIYRVIFGGGLAQNIMVNHKLAQSKVLKCFFASPAAEDISNALGAAQIAFLKHSHSYPKRVVSMFLGKDCMGESALKTIKKKYSHPPFEIIDEVSDDYIASLLSKSFIIGRCSGRMEFGDRALGNRSILADPRNPNICQRINQKIKGRDFWMPFAPAILEEFSEKYLVSSLAKVCEFMSVGFDTTDHGRRALLGAIHPATAIARVQIVNKKRNPYLYNLIRAFYNETGVAALLNTSLNVHGDPIVLGFEDADKVFEQTDLDAMIFGSTLVRRYR